MQFDPNHLYTGIVYDAMRQLGFADHEFLISRHIRPLDADSWCYGPAFTNRGRIVHSDENYADIDAIRLQMYKRIRPRSVVVLQTDDLYCAHAGDITSLIYQKLGVVGFVTDGIVRDSKRIRKLQFPCFCHTTNPIDALNYWGIVDYEQPISLPGLNCRVVVRTGDWIYADSDAVVRIPAEEHARFEETVARNLDREDHCRRAFAELQRPEEVYDRVKEVFDRLGRW